MTPWNGRMGGRGSHALQAVCLLCVLCGNGNGAEYAEAHGSGWHSMMPGGPAGIQPIPF